MSQVQSAQPIEPPKFLLPRAIPKEQAKQLRVVSHAHAMVAAAMDDSEGAFKWPPMIAAELRQLTAKQRQYTIRVAGGQTYNDAYRAAYDVREDRDYQSISSDISQLNTNPRIASAQLILGTWLDRRWLLDAVEVKDFSVANLYELSLHGDTSSARIKATETLARMHGLLIDKREVIHRDANEIDEQAALFKSIIGDIGLNTVIDAEYVVANQQIAMPTVGMKCANCMSIESRVYEDGDGI